MHALDWWDSSHQKELILCPNKFRQISFASSCPPAGNANRWAVNHTPKHWIH